MSGELILDKIKPANLDEIIVLDGHAIINGTMSAQNIDASVDITAMAETIEQLQNRVIELESAAADVSGKVINVTYQESPERKILTSSNEIVLETFGVIKKSSTSILIVQGSISGFGNESGSMMHEWRYGFDTRVLAQSLMFDENNHSKLFPTAAIIKDHTVTGLQELSLVFYTLSGSSGRPFDKYNPNTTDDVRLDQTKSVYVVYEIEQ